MRPFLSGHIDVVGVCILLYVEEDRGIHKEEPAAQNHGFCKLEIHINQNANPREHQCPWEMHQSRETRLSCGNKQPPKSVCYNIKVGMSLTLTQLSKLPNLQVCIVHFCLRAGPLEYRAQWSCLPTGQSRASRGQAGDPGAPASGISLNSSFGPDSSLCPGLCDSQLLRSLRSRFWSWCHLSVSTGGLTFGNRPVFQSRPFNLAGGRNRKTQCQTMCPPLPAQ